VLKLLSRHNILATADASAFISGARSALFADKQTCLSKGGGKLPHSKYSKKYNFQLVQ
jgi:hypothetical protein